MTTLTTSAVVSGLGIISVVPQLGQRVRYHDNGTVTITFLSPEQPVRPFPKDSYLDAAALTLSAFGARPIGKQRHHDHLLDRAPRRPRRR
jgi:hypothetical protein